MKGQEIMNSRAVYQLSIGVSYIICTAIFDVDSCKSVHAKVIRYGSNIAFKRKVLSLILDPLNRSLSPPDHEVRAQSSCALYIVNCPDQRADPLLP